MTEMILAKILVSSMLVGWLVTSIYLYFKGGIFVRRDVKRAILDGLFYVMGCALIFSLIGGGILILFL